MDWQELFAVVVAAAVGSAVGALVVMSSLRRALERRFDAHAASSRDVIADVGVAELGAGDRFAEIAPELVALARNATEGAIHQEDAREWHAPNLDLFNSDDVSESVRDKLRRAAFHAVTARSALQLALRRHRAAIPASIEAELRAFSEHLETNEGETPTAKKRRLAAELDALEERVREAMGA